MLLKELKEILHQKPKVFIVTHKSPDGDAMGSSLGLSNFLEKKGCEVTVVAPTEYPEFLFWIKGNENVKVWGKDNEEIKRSAETADVIFCLDFNALHRIDEVGDLVKKSAAKKIMIDHHQQPDNFADLMISDTSACSTAEMVYEFIEQLGEKHLIDSSIAEALYCGIVTDTGSFRFPSTSAKTHLISAQLMDTGMDHSLVHRRVYDSNSRARLNLIGHCLLNMETIDDLGVAIIKLSKEDHKKFNVKKGDSEGIVNYGLSMSAIQCSVFLREDRGIVKMSFRSKDDFDVNQFARKYFNGGGHINAAGGMSNKSLEEAVQEFKSTIKIYIENHV